MKKLQLLFDKGISNLPSDDICSDDTLQQEQGMYHDGREHCVLQKPVALENITGAGTENTLLFVHHHPDNTKSYIFLSALALLCGNTAITGYTPSGSVKIQAIGNMLIANDNNGLHYFLWKNGSYKYLGQQIPFPQVSFRMGNTVTKQNEMENAQEILEMLHDATAAPDIEWVYVQIKAGKIEEYNDAVTGLYAKNEKAINADKAFVTPFFASYALELYDGSFIYQGVPQLMLPCVRQNTYAKFHDDEWLTLFTDGKELCVKAVFDYTEWSDIVKDVVVFVTDGAHVYDTTVDQVEPDGDHNLIPLKGNILTIISPDAPDYASCNETATYADCVNSSRVYETFAIPEKSVRYIGTQPRDPGVAYFLPLKRYSDQDIVNELKDLELFYKLCSLGINHNDSSFVSTASVIKPHTIENLTTQEVMDTDFYSRCPLNASVMKALNNRLHIANVTRGFAPIETEIFPYIGPVGTDIRDPDNPVPISASISEVYVCIPTPSGEKLIEKSLATPTDERLDLYFYYPDPRAKAVNITITDGQGTQVRRIYKLEEHKSLNGAFYLHALPSEIVDAAPEDTSTFTTSSDATPESLPSQLYVSEVNNPFVFRPEGVVQVGPSEIYALASLTTALSQGQFGQFPLIVFTNEGIWALSVATNGLYNAAHPMSRDVMNRETAPIETDAAVYFTSKKGLMLINGNSVTCVSQQLRPDIFNNCRMAYDYRDSLLYIFSSVPPAESRDSALVYSVRAAAFTETIFDQQIRTIVPDYPDYILDASETSEQAAEPSQQENSPSQQETEEEPQTTEPQTAYSLLSFLARPQLSQDNRASDASIITRPLKLDNGLALKSIMQLRTICNLNNATLSLKLYASNDLRNWKTLKGIRSVPWKYYKMEFTFQQLKATDTFQGVALIAQERRTNKLR